MRSVRKRRSDSSTSFRTCAGAEFLRTMPSRHSSPVWVAMIARSRNPPYSITPTILSDKPKPYTGAVWMKVIPRSAARPVLVHGQHAELVVLGVAFVGLVAIDQVNDVAPSPGSELRGALIGGALPL